MNPSQPRHDVKKYVMAKNDMRVTFQTYAWCLGYDTKKYDAHSLDMISHVQRMKLLDMHVHIFLIEVYV